MKSIRESVLLKTSSNADVQCSGGQIGITGLKSVWKRRIASIVQIKYRARTAQVVTIGGTAYTPTALTNYTVAVYDPNRTSNGYQEAQKKYTYRTPADLTTLGATAALQREAISVALVAKINADATNNAVAATLGSGNGFTVTDELDYYPVRSQTMTNMKFVDTAIPIRNDDQTGFAANNYTVTTAGVTSFGVGAKLAQELPVVDAMYGNLISGVLDAPALATDGSVAVSGQNYDGFVIISMKDVPAHGITGQLAFVPREQYIFVDNGSGSSTTNLAGFLTFEREMRKLITQLYKDDASAVIQWMDQNFVEQGPLGAVPVTTAGIVNKMLTTYGMLNHVNIGTQTIVTASQGANGWLIEQDTTATEGAAYTPDLATVNSQQFIVGKVAATVNCRVSFTTPANVVFMVGFRSKEAHQAAFASYQYLATVGTGAAGTALSTYGNLAAGTPVVTASGTNALTTVSNDLRVQVGIDGVVSAYINNVKYPVYSVGTTPLVIPANTVLVPHLQYTNLNSAAAVINVSEFWAVGSDTVIN